MSDPSPWEMHEMTGAPSKEECEFESAEDYYESLKPMRCIGCECLEMDLSGLELEWVCELEKKGEPCYMPGDSYNLEWHKLQADMKESLKYADDSLAESVKNEVTETAE